MKIINLLPKNKQSELHFEAIYHSLWSVVIISLLSFAFVVVAQFGLKFYLKLQAERIQAEITTLQGQVNKQENASLKAKIRDINNLIADYKKLIDSSTYWSKVVEAFLPLPPKGVKITTFNINPTNKSISITGQSPTRDLVIQLYNSILADNKNFYNIDYPLENIVPATDSVFHFTFYIQNQLLQH